MGRKRNILYAGLAAITAGAVYLFFFILPEKSPTSDQLDRGARVTAAKHSEKSAVHLYFAGKDNSFLIAEKRVLFPSDDPAEFGNLIIDALIKGPRGGLMRTIPVGSAVRAFFITKDGTAYVDFTDAVEEKHPGGSKSELITIYSIVNSLVLNVPEITAVKILIGGREAKTLAGHIDLRFPFKADMLLVR